MCCIVLVGHWSNGSFYLLACSSSIFSIRSHLRDLILSLLFILSVTLVCVVVNGSMGEISSAFLLVGIDFILSRTFICAIPLA